ncbi:hypothetical protein [Herbaspirillum sp. RV1423]|uniref:hypothetical protein n=1 Tax=Herbaspirillum sp. RV1423 TaxID=1443993 RepID=UPI0018CC6914|nr:hypothetical protein [Herbaspirillum sp. RV1423]
MTNEFEANENDMDLDVLMARELTRQYGPLLSGDNLRIALGYPSKEAYRMALVRKSIPVPVFELENRRGKFALTLDVARWLVAERTKAVQTGKKGEEE